MSFMLEVKPCARDSIFPAILPGWSQFISGHIADKDCPLFSLSQETGVKLLFAENKKPAFTLISRNWLTIPDGVSGSKGILAPFLRAEEALACQGSCEFILEKAGWTCAIITLSDKGYMGLREDKSAPALVELVKTRLKIPLVSTYLLPDNADALKSLLIYLAIMQRVNLIVTTGGTGLSERDITPQVTSSLLDMNLPGFSVMRLGESLKKTPNAVISRAVSGIIAKSIVINVPGSVRGAVENLEAVIPALPHALSKLNGNMDDCGG